MHDSRLLFILQSPRKTREKDERTGSTRKASFTVTLTLALYMPRPLIMTKISENVLIVSRCPRIPGYFGTCADSVYQALLFPPPREARTSSYAGKIGTGDEAMLRGGSRGGALVTGPPPFLKKNLTF